MPGLNVLHFTADQDNPSAGFTSYGKHAFISGGFTQPINQVLYNYTTSSMRSSVEPYIAPKKDFNRAVLKQLTTDACNKLKGDDVGARIYVIKYRIGEDRAQWNALTRTNETTYSTVATDHDYSAIDTCASTVTDSAGNTVKHLYSASSQDELTTCLNKIAKDIKSTSFANYKAAQVVE